MSFGMPGTQCAAGSSLPRAPFARSFHDLLGPRLIRDVRRRHADSRSCRPRVLGIQTPDRSRLTVGLFRRGRGRMGLPSAPLGAFGEGVLNH